MVLFAVHLAEGFLPASWCWAGFLVAIPLAALGCWRLHECDIPRIALATAAYFVASSIHLPVLGVHLVLNGLLGVMLGFRAGLAIFIGLTLQCLLLGHGGQSTLGANMVLQTIPAFVVAGLFRQVARSSRGNLRTISLAAGFLAGAGVLATVLLQSALVHWTSDEAMPALLWIGVHLPVALVEGVVVGFMVDYLARVKPELIGLRRLSFEAIAEAEKTAATAESVR